MKCGSNHFCVGFEPDHKVYCYGSKDGCLWGQNSCTTNADCNKYSTSSAKYTDGDTPQCGNNLGWRGDACPDPYVGGDFNTIRSKFNETKREYIALMDKLQTSCLSLSTPKPNNLILSYRVRNDQSVLTDSSPSNVNANVVNKPSYSASGGPNNSGYLTLDPSKSQYILTTTPISVGGPSISVFLWVYPKGNGVILTELGQSTINTSWHDSQIEMVNGVMKFSVWPYTTVLESHTVPLNQWHHVGFVYNQQQTKLTAYVNGVEVTSGNMTRQAPRQLFYAIGGRDTTNLGNGGYGSFRFSGMQVYNTALTSAEVLQKYQGIDLTSQCQRATKLNDEMKTALIQMSNLLKDDPQTLPAHQALVDLAAELDAAKDVFMTTLTEQDDVKVLANMAHGHWILWLLSSIIVLILLWYLWK